MCKLKNIDLLYWATEIIGLALTAVVGFISIEICIPLTQYISKHEI